MLYSTHVSIFYTLAEIYARYFSYVFAKNLEINF